MNRPFPNPRRPGSTGAIPDTIFILLVINGLAFAGQQFMPGLFERYFPLWPPGSFRADFYPWQLITYGFLHGDVMHLLFNMFMLWMFGREVEAVMGPRKFLVYYLVCVAGAGLVQLFVASLQGGYYATVGASGGVFGILLAFGMAFPNRTILLLFPPIPMKAKYMVVLFGLLELYFGVSGRAPGIANFAHLGGMVFGFALLMFWRRGRRR